MHVNIIVPTYNGAHKLPVLFQALQQIEEDFRLVIVVDGSTDNTMGLLEKIADYGFSDYEIVVKKNSGRGASRNTGVDNSLDGLLIFLDDDIIPPLDLIKVHLDHQEKNPDSILSIGSWVDDTTYQNDFERYRIYTERRWKQSQNLSGRTEIGMDNLSVSSSNFSLTKSIFNRLNGFDERLSDNEDLDLAIRAIKEKIKIFYDPTIKSIHNDYATFDDFKKRIKAYRQSMRRLIKLKPEYGLKLPETKKLGLIKHAILKLFKLMRGTHFPSTWFFRYLPFALKRRIFEAIIAIELADL